MATGRQWTDAAGQKQEKTEWHRCVVWNTKSSTLADIVEKYVHKGDKLYLEGRVEYREWNDKDGARHFATDITVRELIMLGSPKGRDDQQRAPSSPAARRATAAAGARKGGDDSDFPDALADEDDDLPF